jgi:hypothetical protein
MRINLTRNTFIVFSLNLQLISVHSSEEVQVSPTNTPTPSILNDGSMISTVAPSSPFASIFPSDKPSTAPSPILDKVPSECVVPYQRWTERDCRGSFVSDESLTNTSVVVDGNCRESDDIGYYIATCTLDGYIVFERSFCENKDCTDCAPGAHYLPEIFIVYEHKECYSKSYQSSHSGIVNYISFQTYGTCNRTICPIASSFSGINQEVGIFIWTWIFILGSIASCLVFFCYRHQKSVRYIRERREREDRLQDHREGEERTFVVPGKLIYVLLIVS